MLLDAGFWIVEADLRVNAQNMCTGLPDAGFGGIRLLGRCSEWCVGMFRAANLGSEKCLWLSRPRACQMVWGNVKKYQLSLNCLGAQAKGSVWDVK